MSENGRYVAFNSQSTNLVGDTTSPSYGIYLKDMQTGTTTSLFSNGSGVPIQEIGTAPVAISNDGRFVLFGTSKASDFVSGTRTGYEDVLLLDRSTNTWQILDSPVSGGFQGVYSVPTSMSCDGSFILFQSTATNLVTGDSGSEQHIILIDLRNGVTTTDLNAGATATSSEEPEISCNGEYITFATKDRTFVSPTPTGMDSNYHLVEYNRITGASSYIDTANGTNFPQSSYGISDGSVSDGGDIVMQWFVTSYLGSVGEAYVKHISDGSGTMENLEKDSGGYVSPYWLPTDNTTYISGNGKYTVVPVNNAYTLGLTATDQCDASSLNGTNCDVVRIATGLE